nr:hypothetical protein [uncultured Methanobacterium sp.]
MAEKKGKTTKKILHLGHILLEFFRKILKAMGKSDHSTGALKQSTHGSKSGVSKGASTKSGLTASKTAKTGSTHANVYGGATTAESAAGSVTAGVGATGAAVSGTTVLTILVIAVVTVVGLGSYVYNTEQQSIGSVKNLIWGPNVVFGGDAMGVEIPQQNQQTEVNNSQSTVTETNNPGTTSSQDSGEDSGTSGSNIEFVVPENP